MYCRNCGNEVDNKAVACPGCGVPPRLERKFCHGCGGTTEPNQVLCTKCGVALESASPEKSRLVAGLLGIFLGALGIHKFYLGYKNEGAVMLLVALVGGVLTLGLATWAVHVVGLIEGIVYLTKSDEEFASIYVLGRKAWF